MPIRRQTRVFSEALATFLFWGWRPVAQRAEIYSGRARFHEKSIFGSAFPWHARLNGPFPRPDFRRRPDVGIVLFSQRRIR